MCTCVCIRNLTKCSDPVLHLETLQSTWQHRNSFGVDPDHSNVILGGDAGWHHDHPHRRHVGWHEHRPGEPGPPLGRTHHQGSQAGVLPRCPSSTAASPAPRRHVLPREAAGIAAEPIPVRCRRAAISLGMVLRHSTICRGGRLHLGSLHVTGDARRAGLCTVGQMPVRVAAASAGRLCMHTARGGQRRSGTGLPGAAGRLLPRRCM